jgi:hypothetical protein
MDGLTDPPMVRASIPGRRDKEINLKWVNYKQQAMVGLKLTMKMI